MHYLVDAYNLLFRVQKKVTSLEKNRRALISYLNEAAEQLHLNLTLVFDGSKETLSYPLRAHFDAVALVYAPQSADTYILQEVEESRHPAKITVVSSDRELTRRCSLYGAEVQTIEAFLQRLIRKEKQRATPRPMQESSAQFARLLALFEQRLSEQDSSSL